MQPLLEVTTSAAVFCSCTKYILKSKKLSAKFLIPTFFKVADGWCRDKVSSKGSLPVRFFLTVRCGSVHCYRTALYDAAFNKSAPHRTTQHSTAQHSTAQHSTAVVMLRLGRPLVHNSPLLYVHSATDQCLNPGRRRQDLSCWS